MISAGLAVVSPRFHAKVSRFAARVRNQHRFQHRTGATAHRKQHIRIKQRVEVSVIHKLVVRLGHGIPGYVGRTVQGGAGSHRHEAHAVAVRFQPVLGPNTRQEDHVAGYREYHCAFTASLISISWLS